MGNLGPGASFPEMLTDRIDPPSCPRAALSQALALPSLAVSLLLSACGGSPASTTKPSETPDAAILLFPPAHDAGSGDSRADASHDATRDAGGDAAGDAGRPTLHDAAGCEAQGKDLQMQLDQAVLSWQTDGGVSGAVLGVSTPGCGTWTGASGLSTATLPVTVTDDFRVGSITKTFVATAVIELEAEGKLSFSDALEKWVTGFPNGSGITLDQLLHHTSGIYDYTSDATFDSTESNDPGTVWTPAQLVQIAAGHAAVFAPGASWGYSNTNYILLGLVVEKVTGDDVGKVLHSLAIDKAGLSHTTLAGYEPAVGTMAHGYATTGVDVTTLFDPSYAWTAGAVVSNAPDLVSWASSLYGGNLLSASGLTEMLDTVPTGQTGTLYGRGVFVFDTAATGVATSWGHPGDINGYHSQMSYFPDSKTIIVSLVNSDSADPNAVTVAALTVLGFI